MNRLYVYIITLIVTLFSLLVNVFGDFSFTVSEIIFFSASILMVFSFEKTPTEDLDKPQIHQYVTNRLNFYNYLAAGNIAVCISIYVLLKYIDPTRALLYLISAWILCAFAFKNIYTYTAFRKFKYSLSDYLIHLSTKSDELFHVTGAQIVKFVDALMLDTKAAKPLSIRLLSKESSLDEDTAALLFYLSQEYIEITQKPLKSAELP
jgi:hypothetical protein